MQAATYHVLWKYLQFIAINYQNSMHLCSSPYVKPVKYMHSHTLLETNKSSGTQQPNTASLSQNPYRAYLLLGSLVVHVAANIISTTFLVQKLSYYLTKKILIYLYLSTIS